MYRVNSVSKQIVKLLVVEQGTDHLVTLLPQNFVFTEKVTDQMKILEKDGVIKVRETASFTRVPKTVSNTEKLPVIKKPESTLEGKLDFISNQPSKVSKKRK